MSTRNEHAPGVGVGVGVGLGVGGTSKPLTRKMTPPLFEDQNSKSPVTGSMAGPSLAPNPAMTFCMFATIGSPFESSGAVTSMPCCQSTISTLLEGNTGELGGTKAMPSGPAPLGSVARRLADVILNVPLPSGTNSQ